ncbi:bile acid:sodium symporter family protein [Humibacter ginsenosidimutans]|uniref:Bile acid:sodium symporter family protein n=1 Tax=Humibacter ginsenosidimutans TaxID=2599293 RepID=A0A5B8M7A6_9MICO|nr:bile acid:sodium symporter family protein [Humibacter ginsenosidimutans]QDZ16276.1 bile acid:sodium symporter family protein [Humibacter ginsenosidimutans]
MNVDNVTVNFAPGSLIALDVVLGLIMFGIALDTSLSDFKAVLKAPKAMIIALIAQIVLLPAVTFCLTLLLNVQASIALGMILVACCPPGNISQVLTYRSRGNVALSVSMTAVSNVIYIFVLPLNVALWGHLHPTARSIMEQVNVNVVQMVLEILLVIGVPFVLGLFIRHRWPRFAGRVHPYARWISLIGLVGFIVAALAGNWAVFIEVIGVVLIVVFLHDAVALALGYASARIGGLGVRERKAITFEVGIRNSALGLGLIFTFFGGLGGMAVVAGWWGIWDIIAGLAVATLWGWHTRRKEAAAGVPAAAGAPASAATGPARGASIAGDGDLAGGAAAGDSAPAETGGGAA